ncbi:MAG: hypothetical protein ACQEV6_12005 [Pseudomonadota bacterium]
MNRLPLNQLPLRTIALALVVALPPDSWASTLHLPHPWRQEAVVEGRDETYNTERFLHLLTFRHSQALPGPLDNGVRGTGGSVSSRRLYLDFRFRQDFGFQGDRQGFLLDIQRSEDLDGAYQRQLVGFRHNLTDDTELWLQGDVFADKSQSDVYFSARHYLGPQHWLHASWILPDAYFNDKTDSGDELARKPQSFFAQWHSGNDTAAPALGTTVSMTYSPPSELNSRTENLVVENENLKAAISHSRRSAHWLWRLEISGEWTRRHYQLNGQQLAGPIGFDRDHLLVDARITDSRRRFQPRLGASYLVLEESGFFGRALNDAGEVSRREPTIYTDLTLPLSARTTLSPGLYLSKPDISEQYLRNRDRRETDFTGKLTLPFKLRLSENEDAVLTLNPTFYLHQFGFGGGNLQLHWPM